MALTANGNTMASIFAPLVMAGCLSLTTVLPATASSFGPATTLASRPTEVLTSSAIDGAGDALVAWVEAGAKTYHQKARYHQVSGTWATAVSIGPPSSNASPPALQFTPTGSAVAASTDGTAVYATDLSSNGLRALPHRLFDTTFPPLLAINAGGSEAIVAGLMAMRRAADSAAWGAPETIPNPPTGQTVQIDAIALGSNGDLIVPMEAVEEECDRVSCQFTVTLYVAREVAPGVGWTMSAPLAGPFTSTAYNYYSLPLIYSKIQATIVFQNGTSVTAQSALANTWSAPIPVFSSSGASSLYVIGGATNAQGMASIAISEVADSVQNIVIDGSLADGSWQSPIIVSQPDPSAEMAIAFGKNPNGGSALAWSDPNGTIRVASRLRPATPWRPLQVADPTLCNDSVTDCSIAWSASLNNAGQEVVSWTTKAAQGANVPVKVKATTR